MSFNPALSIPDRITSVVIEARKQTGTGRFACLTVLAAVVAFFAVRIAVGH